MLREYLKNILIRFNLLKYYYFLRYGLKHQIRAALKPQDDNFYTLSPHLLIALNACFKKAQSLDILKGTDYMEFGLFRGFSFWYAQAATNELNIADMRYYGFDSFKGLPKISGVDVNSDFSKGDFKCGRNFVEKKLNEFGVDWDKTFLIEGFYNDSLNDGTKKRYEFRNCSICVIDCDLYEAANDVLDFVTPMLSDTSIMIFDDWNCNKADDSQGERKAFSEFLKKNPHIKAEPYAQFGHNCQTFLLKKTVREF